MSSKSTERQVLPTSGETHTLTESPPSPTIGSWADWSSVVIATLALGVSLIALRISHNSHKEQKNTSAKLQRSSEFNQKYGSPLIDALRTLERKLSTLDVLLTPGFASKPLDELKGRVEESRIDWEDATHEVKLLLSETQSSKFHNGRPWTKKFSELTTIAEAHLDTIGNHSKVNCYATFKVAVEFSLKSYNDAINEVRSLLDEERQDSSLFE